MVIRSFKPLVLCALPDSKQKEKSRLLWPTLLLT